MTRPSSNPAVHLELHTTNLARACGFYTQLFSWRIERIDTGSGCYLALELGDRIEGGVVERDTDRPVWLPYVQVDDISEATERAWMLGATVLLRPREGPAGWRSAVASPAGGQIALWQRKA
jgi:predicted enzyme related to lactoylglutathione lyase